MEEDIVYFRHFWEHILMKQMFEIEQRYFGRVPLATELYEELAQKFRGRGTNVIAFADFSVTTSCSLKCRACTQWIPYLKERKTICKDEVRQWLDDIFRYVDYIHIISPFGGEAFLNPDFGEILTMLLKRQEEGKIGFIRIVTNGTVFPSEQLQKVLCNPNVLILISDYENGINEAQKKEKARLLAFLEKNKCRYYLVKMDWTDLGQPETEPKHLTETEQRDYFESCFIKDCAGIYDGKLYHCPRSYALENMGLEKPGDGEVIDFKNLHSREEAKLCLDRFYRLESLKACAWCKAPSERMPIPSAEQVENNN